MFLLNSRRLRDTTGSRAILSYTLVSLVIASAFFTPASSANDSAQAYTADRSRSALGHPFGSMGDDDLDRFALGRSFFSIPWVEAPASTRARDGLGPLFNANSCIACHRHHGGGSAVASTGRIDRSIVMQIDDDPIYGRQIGINGVHGIPPEASVQAHLSMQVYTYADGTKVKLRRPAFQLEKLQYGPLQAERLLKPRRAPALIGLGLVERIPPQQIERHADPQDVDGDGVSGRVRLVWSLPDSAWRLGRFGWKATRATVLEQTASALNDDMSLTSVWFPNENCSALQRNCMAAESGGNPEVPVARVAAIAFYLSRLQAPQGGSDYAGLRLFDQIGCNACHRRGYQLSEGLTLNPFGDFLLHDMGDALSDPVADSDPGEAREWRTAPLWGIGLARRLNPDVGYLHDGRATTLEQAILWHAGEADAARVKFSALEASQRAAIITFLEAL